MSGRSSLHRTMFPTFRLWPIHAPDSELCGVCETWCSGLRHSLKAERCPKQCLPQICRKQHVGVKWRHLMVALGLRCKERQTFFSLTESCEKLRQRPLAPLLECFCADQGRAWTALVQGNFKSRSTAETLNPSGTLLGRWHQDLVFLHLCGIPMVPDSSFSCRPSASIRSCCELVAMAVPCPDDVCSLFFCWIFHSFSLSSCGISEPGREWCNFHLQRRTHLSLVLSTLSSHGPLC